jgi:hypothetical protein
MFMAADVTQVLVDKEGPGLEHPTKLVRSVCMEGLFWRYAPAGFQATTPEAICAV